MTQFLRIAHLIVSISLVVLILLQERSGGTSGIFGVGEGGFYQARRGLEKTIFITTIVLMGLFAALALLNLIL